MLIDFHVHTSFSTDVQTSLADRIQQIKQAGLDGFCLTDKGTVAGYEEAKRLATEAGINIFVGFEAITNQGHYLVFVPEPQKLPSLESWIRTDEQSRMLFSSLRPSVQALDGIMIAAHPYDRTDPSSPRDSLAKLNDFFAIEVLNASRTTQSNELAEELATSLGVPGIGGSDVHDNPEVIGRAATLVRTTISDEADLIQCVRSYDLWPVAIGSPMLPLENKSFEPRPSRTALESRPGQSHKTRSNKRPTQRKQHASDSKKGKGFSTRNKSRKPPPRLD